MKQKEDDGGRTKADDEDDPQSLDKKTTRPVNLTPCRNVSGLGAGIAGIPTPLLAFFSASLAGLFGDTVRSDLYIFHKHSVHGT